MKYLLFMSILLIASTAQSQEMGTFTDPRDGRIYKTVTYEDPLLGDGITIMAENLDYKMPGSWAYDNDSRYRKNLGLLYTWSAAMKACPDGWHLPNDREWFRIEELIEAISREQGGSAMKATFGWDNRDYGDGCIETGNGTNNSGFNALPAGWRATDGIYRAIGTWGYWWSSTERDEGEASYFRLMWATDDLSRRGNSKKDAYSCRCFKE